MGAQRTDGVIFQSAVSLCEIFANFLQTSSWLLISKYFRQQHIARAVDQYQQYAHNSPVCNETDIRLTYCRFCLCQNKWWKLFPATYSARQAVFRTTSFIEIESTFMFIINLCTLNDLAFVLLERYNIFFYVYYLHCTLICILDNNCDVGVPGQVSPVNKRRVFSGWVT